MENVQVMKNAVKVSEGNTQVPFLAFKLCFDQFFNSQFHFIRGTYAIRHWVRKKNHQGIDNTVPAFRIVCNTISFSTTNALLYTAALDLFRLKRKTSCIAEIWPTMARNTTAQRRDDGLRKRRLNSWDASQPNPFNVSPFSTQLTACCKLDLTMAQLGERWNQCPRRSSQRPL